MKKTKTQRESEKKKKKKKKPPSVKGEKKRWRDWTQWRKKKWSKVTADSDHGTHYVVLITEMPFFSYELWNI